MVNEILKSTATHPDVSNDTAMELDESHTQSVNKSDFGCQTRSVVIKKNTKKVQTVVKCGKK